MSNFVRGKFDFHSLLAFLYMLKGGCFFARCPNCDRWFRGGENGPGFRGAFGGQGTCSRRQCAAEVMKINEANRPAVQKQLDDWYSNQSLTKEIYEQV